MVEVLLAVIIGFMVIGAIFALETENMFAAVLAWGGVCLSLSAAFLALNALDLALIQMAVEIIVIVLLLRATGSLNQTIARESSILNALPRYAAAIILASGFISLLYFALKEAPPFGMPIYKSAQTVINTATQTTGFANLAGAVFLRIRALDAFAAAALLLVAVLGAMSILRAKERK